MFRNGSCFTSGTRRVLDDKVMNENNLIVIVTNGTYPGHV
jgi:hypothetical protein